MRHNFGRHYDPPEDRDPPDNCQECGEPLDNCDTIVRDAFCSSKCRDTYDARFVDVPADVPDWWDDPNYQPKD
jgi:hypothetical protein